MIKKACKQCKRLIRGETCPVCKITKMIDNWKGRIIVLNAEKSEIAKKVKITSSGEYALRV